MKALNKRAEDKYPLLKNVCGKDGTAVIKKKIMMLFVNATKSKKKHPFDQCCSAFWIVLQYCAILCYKLRSVSPANGLRLAQV